MRLVAIMLLFKEAPFVEACIRSIYPVVDSIICVTQYDRTLNGTPVEADRSVEIVLGLPDPENKLVMLIPRDVARFPGQGTEAKLRNAAMLSDPYADYFLIVDSDEIWARADLEKSWAYVQETRAAGYRGSCYLYFKTWNYRVVREEPSYQTFLFLRRGFQFLRDRAINWHGPARWKEYLRTGRKPKTLRLPEEWKHHHGSCVGDDERMENKLRHYTHSDLVAPDWFERVWKNFTPEMKDFYYFRNLSHEFKGIDVIPSTELPAEISRCEWPVGWIEK